MTLRASALAALVTTALLLLTPSGAAADTVPDPATDHASCLGSGSAFYGTFAPEQRAFVAAAVIDAAAADGSTPGETYSFFAREKEGGSIPSPCGTRLE